MNNALLYKAQVRWLFHAHIKIKIPVFCDESLFDELFSILEDVDAKYNSYTEGSFIDQINKNAGEFVEVDEETIHILGQILYLSNFFDGEYDITVMPLIRLWGFYKEGKRRLPNAEEIAVAKSKVGYNAIEIKDTLVRIAEGQEIITGSFLKSYAVDKLILKIKEIGITDAIINAGGSTIRAVNNKVHPYWQIDVEDPTDKLKHVFRLKLSNACFSTSAQTKTYIEIEGNKYGHIISPITGHPSLNKQIGIISDNCFVGDIISTGLYNQTQEGFLDKMRILSEQYTVAGFVMDRNDNIVFTDNFREYLINDL